MLRAEVKKGKGSPYSITERRVLGLNPVLGSQPAGDVSHKPARPAVTPATLEGCYQHCCLVNRGTMSVNSLPKTVTRQRRGCDLNPGPSALTTRLPSRGTQPKRSMVNCPCFSMYAVAFGITLSLQ